MGCRKLVLRWFGRLLLLGVLAAQTAIYSHYASLYFNDNYFYLLNILVLPVIICWISIAIGTKKQLNCQWCVWLTYTIFVLAPMVILLFRVAFTAKIDKGSFFGPNFLKITMCGAPAIALLLLTTAKDSQKYEGSVVQLCGSIALDSFDELELLEMLLHPEIASHLSGVIERCIIAFVCISFFLTAMEMAENKFDGRNVKPRSYGLVYFWRLVLQLFLVNTPLLVIRLVVWRKYKHDASIFIAKNAIIIVTSSMEIIRLIIGSN